MNLDSIVVENTIIYKAATIIAAEKVEGDYLEFGVYEGDSIIESYRTMKAVFAHHQRVHDGRTAEDAWRIRNVWEKLRLFAFDSFQGLPATRGIDKHTSDFAQGKYACSEERFRRQLSRHRVDTSKVITVPGWFDETCLPATIAKYDIRKAAVVHIDCDLYSSTKTVLNFVTPLLTDGTVLIFDDWYCFRGHPELGERRAFQEWSAQQRDWVFTEYQKQGPWANSFIANRRNLTTAARLAERP
jgi:hypothetical protein